MDRDVERPLSSKDWIASVHRGQADAAAGRTIPLKDALRDLQATIDGVEDTSSVKQPRRTAR